MVVSKKTLEKVEAIKNFLIIKPPKHFLCATSEIQYFDWLAEKCLKEYREIENKTDALLTYLEETLTKLQREEFTYNRQTALNLCQTILERNKEYIRVNE